MKQVVIKIEDVPQCDVGAPMPMILSDEINIYLFYFIDKHDPEWDGSYVKVRNSEDIGLACITFNIYKQFKFGSPNDEAINGHPLYKYGLEPYSFWNVENSLWIDELIKMNRVHPNHKDEYFSDYNHFIYFFHDSCFEVVCKNYNVETFKDKKMFEVIKGKISKLSI